MLDNDELDARALAFDAARESRQRFQLEAFAGITIGDGPEWLVDDIVPAAGFTVIYGEAGCGKSFLASDMGLAVALGQRIAERYESLRKQHDARSERWTNLGNLLSRIQHWLPSLPATVEPHKVDAVAPRRGESIAAAVERVRGTIRAMQAEMDSVKAAPIPSKDAKARIRAHVASLAETATPNLYQLIETGALDIRYPQMQVALNVSGKASGSGDSVLGRAMGQIVDPIALLAWLDSGKLIAAFEAEIDRAADDAAALDDKTRAKRTAELQAAILDARILRRTPDRAERAAGARRAAPSGCRPARRAGTVARHARAARVVTKGTGR